MWHQLNHGCPPNCWPRFHSPFGNSEKPGNSEGLWGLFGSQKMTKITYFCVFIAAKLALNLLHSKHLLRTRPLKSFVTVPFLPKRSRKPSHAPVSPKLLEWVTQLAMGYQNPQSYFFTLSFIRIWNKWCISSSKFQKLLNSGDRWASFQKCAIAIRMFHLFSTFSRI